MRTPTFAASLDSSYSCDALTELLLDLALEELHLHRLAVHQEHVPGLRHADELHDALGVRVGAEGHVLDLQLHVQLQESQTNEAILMPGFPVERNSFTSGETLSWAGEAVFTRAGSSVG